MKKYTRALCSVRGTVTLLLGGGGACPFEEEASSFAVALSRR